MVQHPQNNNHDLDGSDGAVMTQGEMINSDNFNTMDQASVVVKRELYMRPDMGIIDFQLSKSFHNRFLSPSAAQKPNLSFGMRNNKATHLPSDHPEMQGVMEVPTINEKSIQMVESKR